MSPEVTLGLNYDNKSDVFSMGILLFVVFTEKYEPYSDYFNNNSFSTLPIETKVAKDENFRPKFPNNFFSSDLKDLITKMWSFNAKERPSMKEIFEFLQIIKDKNKN